MRWKMPTAMEIHTMSRTYRSIPHFVTKESLYQDFTNGFFRVFHCGGTFHNAAHYARAALAKERSDSAIFSKTLLSEVTGIAPNGSPLGYKEWSRSRWAKQFANKARRSNDKSVVAEALSELDEEIILDKIEYKDYYNYDDWLLTEEESPDWDDDTLFDDPAWDWPDYSIIDEYYDPWEFPG